jgi:hypothetical protein
MRVAVFLGPSLPVETARTVLADAWYCEPCRCGDLLQILRLHPDRVLLIDGHFSWTPAPWHKEFLIALDHGVEVYGASSMGALRAAELNQFGMIGVGRIYEDFASGRIDGDDEVAVMHSDDSFGYQQMNDTLINIRYTLDAAVKVGQIDRSIADQLLERIRSKYYPDRSLLLAIREYTHERGDDLSSLRRWLGQGNFVDQKSLDAIQALHRVKDDPPSQPPPPHTNYTRYIRELIRWTSCSTFRKVYDWLPESEARLTRLRASSPRIFEAVRGVAEGLIQAVDVAKVADLWPKRIQELDEGAEVARELTQGWNEVGKHLASASSWLVAQSEAIRLNRLAINIMASFLQKISFPAIGVEFPAESLMTSPDVPVDPHHWLQHAMRSQALLVLCLGSLARARGLTVKSSIFEKELATFRVSNELQESEAMGKFLEILGLERAQFGVLFFDYLNYKRVFCSDRSDALLESRPSPVQNALGDAFDCLNRSLVRNSTDSSLSSQS